MFNEIDKIGDNPKFDEITKFEILNPKIQNFQFRQNLTKNQNSATVVYRNFAISSKCESQNFPKFVRIWPNKCYKIFSKFWSRYQNHQNLQNWLSSPKFWRKFLKPFGEILGLGVARRRVCFWKKQTFVFKNVEKFKLFFFHNLQIIKLVSRWYLWTDPNPRSRGSAPFWKCFWN